MSPTTITIYLGFHVKCTTFFPDFNHIWIFSTFIPKSHEYQLSQKFGQWETCGYMRADTQTDGRIGVTQLTGGFREYANAPQE
jgi:hypothetical protein